MRGWTRYPVTRGGLRKGGLLALVLAACVLSATALAQDERPWSLDPVFEQNAVDGFVLGLEGDYALYGVRPFAAIGYGLDSGALRYRGGLGWGPLSGEAYNWHDTHLLGRSGESGLALRAELGGTALTLASARPWRIEDDEDEAHEVGYVNLHGTQRWEGPFDIALALTGDVTVGAVAGRGPVQSMQQRVTLRRGEVRLTWSAGSSSNEAELPGFHFTQAMRGYEGSLRGHSFWRARLERRVPLWTVPLDLPPPPFPVPGAEDAFEDLAFRVEASGFGELLSLQPVPSAVEPDIDLTGPQTRLGWGTGLVLSLGGFELRFDLFFDREGAMRSLFG